MMDYRSVIQKIIYVCIDPAIRGMAKVGLTPNMVTALGFLGNVGAAWLFIEASRNISIGETSAAFSLIAWAGVVIIAAGLFDMVDGRLARLNNMASPFGALWDSTLDRYSELVTLSAICFLLLEAGWTGMGLATLAAMVGSVMVSYVRARAEGLGIECKVGLMQRPERVVVTAVAAIITGLTGNLWWLSGGMALTAVLTNLTAFWRIAHCYREINRRDGKG